MATRKLPKTLTTDETAALLAAPNLDAPTGLRDRVMMELMLRCGLRVSETCRLYVRDVDWREGTIRLRPEVAKGGREAVVYMDRESQAWLERWKAIRREYAGGKPHLFVRVRSGPDQGGPLNRRGVYKMMLRRAHKAGIKRATPHMLRHSFATALLREGFNLREVQTALRHADVRNTVIYTEIVDVELAAKLRQRR
jgi:integrase/recombinase XerD